MSLPISRASQAVPFEQYIDTLVSHSGLPYQDAAKFIIRSHLSSLLREFPSLHAKIEVSSHDDGNGRPAPSLLLQLFGTIPIFFLQVAYNIPVVIWLSEQYPFCSPVVFVVPSRFMIIRNSHPLVGSSGLVSCSHLLTWVYPTSNLVELVQSLSSAFGQDPPLYTIYCVPNGSGSMSAPSPSSSSALPAVSSSFLGPSSLFNRPSSAVSTLGVSLRHSPSPPPPSASQWPPSYNRTMRSLLAGTRLSPAQHQSHDHDVSMARHLSSPSSISGGSPTFLPAAHQHSVDRFDGGASAAEYSAVTSMTASWLEPGKSSEWHSFPVAGSLNMDQPEAALQSSGPLKRPNEVAQALRHPVLSKLEPASLLDPGQSSSPYIWHDLRHLVTYPPSLPASNPGPGFSVLAHSPLAMSHVSVNSTSSSNSRLGYSTGYHWHSSYPNNGVPFVPPPQITFPGAVNPALVAPRMQLQQIKTAVPPNGNDEGNPPNSTLASPLLPSPHNSNSSSISAQQRPRSPTMFSNPLLTYSKDQPSDRKQNLMNALIESLQRDIGEFQIMKESDMLKLMDIECLLKRRQAICKDGIETLQQQKENIEVQLQNVLINTELLETWLLTNNKRNVEVYVDKIFELCDGLSHQLVECTALDLVLEDALFCLDQSAELRILPLDPYLKLVRTLCREQFFQRALAVKVRSAQEQD